MPGSSQPPLAGIKVVELAGLAPVPYCGLLLADYGATVLRIDRPHPAAHSTSEEAPRTNDTLTRNKRSIALDLKQPRSKALLYSLLATADVLLEPFRPGVLESLGLAPAELLARNPRLVIGRLTGFRRDGKYASMAGHDINYLAVSGVLSQLGGPEPAAPQPPLNILGDFAGGGMACALGVLLALLARHSTGRGQVVESNMVDAVQSLGTMPRLGRKTPMGDRPRGNNMLDGGAPFYSVYRTKDGGWMSVGALEPQFFDALAKGLGIDRSRWASERMDRDNWPELRTLLQQKFASRTRKEWEQVFDGTDACCTPVLEQAELEQAGEVMRAAVTLTGTPAVENVGEQSWRATGLRVGEGGEDVLNDWMGWRRGTNYEVEGGALVQVNGAKL